MNKLVIIEFHVWVSRRAERDEDIPQRDSAYPACTAVHIVRFERWTLEFGDALMSLERRMSGSSVGPKTCGPVCSAQVARDS